MTSSRFSLANRIGCWFNGLYLHLQLPSVSRTSSGRIIDVALALALNDTLFHISC